MIDKMSNGNTINSMMKKDSDGRDNSMIKMTHRIERMKVLLTDKEYFKDVFDGCNNIEKGLLSDWLIWLNEAVDDRLKLITAYREMDYRRHPIPEKYLNKIK